MSVIPTGATIDSAEFRIYCGQYYGSVNGELAYYRVTEDWSETAVTYLNMPAHTDTGAVFTSNWPSSGSWHSVDITDTVIAWFDGTIDNFGLYSHSRNCTAMSDCAFYSSRVSNAAYRPKLVVNYSGGSTVEEGSWGEIKDEFND